MLYRNILIVLDDKNTGKATLCKKAVELAEDEHAELSVITLEDDSMELYREMLDVVTTPKIKITEESEHKLAKFNAEFDFTVDRILKTSGGNSILALQKVIDLYNIDIILIGYKHGVVSSIFSRDDAEDDKIINNITTDILITSVA